jgi:hypothetical protein
MLLLNPPLISVTFSIPTFILQTPRGADLLHRAIQQSFKRSRGSYPGRPVSPGFRAFEPQPRHVQTIHERIEHPANVFLRNYFVHGDRKQRSLCATFGLNEAHK